MRFFLVEDGVVAWFGRVWFGCLGFREFRLVSFVVYIVIVGRFFLLVVGVRWGFRRRSFGRSMVLAG